MSAKSGTARPPAIRGQEHRGLAGVTGFMATALWSGSQTQGGGQSLPCAPRGGAARHGKRGAGGKVTCAR